MPFRYVFIWRCHHVVPVAKLLPRTLCAQDHLTQLSPAGLPIIVDHGNVDSCGFDQGWLHCARKCFIEDGRTALWFLLCLHSPQHLVSTYCYPYLCLSIYTQCLNNEAFNSKLSITTDKKNDAPGAQYINSLTCFSAIALVQVFGP